MKHVWMLTDKNNDVCLFSSKKKADDYIEELVCHSGGCSYNSEHHEKDQYGKWVDTVSKYEFCDDNGEVVQNMTLVKAKIN